MVEQGGAGRACAAMHHAVEGQQMDICLHTRVMGTPDCLAVSAATKLQSLLRRRFSSRIFCSLERSSRGTSA